MSILNARAYSTRWLQKLRLIEVFTEKWEHMRKHLVPFNWEVEQCTCEAVTMWSRVLCKRRAYRGEIQTTAVSPMIPPSHTEIDQHNSDSCKQVHINSIDDVPLGSATGQACRKTRPSSKILSKTLKYFRICFKLLQRPIALTNPSLAIEATATKSRILVGPSRAPQEATVIGWMLT